MEHQQVTTLSADDLSQTHLIKLHMNTGSAQPVKMPLRRLPQHQREEVRCLMEDMQHRKVIEPSSSLWGAAVVSVR
ncbi:hypothetical protein T01_3977 [Trichinella spiralis]|uniref:Uncharacterized protein n=1 Tax=Trichinella spiralis TaxID=6334 RepID=A0A0V1BDJ8_TRISP|nr:hypothetical protein T01_3977 [Trichinella spiralis]